MYKISLLQTGIIWSQYKNKINNFKISWIFIICNFCEPSNALPLYIHWEKSYNSINGPFSCMRDPKAIPGLRFPVPADTQGRYTRPLLEVGGRSLLVAPAHSSLLPLRCSFLPAAPSHRSFLLALSYSQTALTRFKSFGIWKKSLFHLVWQKRWGGTIGRTYQPTDGQTRPLILGYREERTQKIWW